MRKKTPKVKKQNISFSTKLLGWFGGILFWGMFAYYAGIPAKITEYFSSPPATHAITGQATAPCDQPGKRSVQEWENCYPVKR